MNIFRRISNAVRGDSSKDKDKDKDKYDYAWGSDNGWGDNGWAAPEPKGAPFPQTVPKRSRYPGRSRRATAKSPFHDHSHQSRDHYAQCAEIWDKQNSQWMIFDPKDAPSRPVIKHDDHIYFCVTARYQDHWSEPYDILTHFAEPLLSFVNTTCGSYGAWGNGAGTWVNEGVSNALEMGQGFRSLKKIKAKLEEIQDVRKKTSRKSTQDKLDLVKCLGNMAVDNRTPEADLDKFLGDLEKQLKVFVAYLEKKFKPIAERLASALRYGYMEFDLLPYYFEPGQHVSFTSANGNLLAMNVTHVHVYDDASHVAPNSCKRLSHISIEGFGYTWEGVSFTTQHLKTSCYSFTGKKELSELPVKILTPEKREELTARGRRYKAEAGIRYRVYKGDRIVIDRLGFVDAQVYESNKKRAKIRRRDSYDSYANPDPPTLNPEWSTRSVAWPQTNEKDIADELLCFLPVDLYGYNLSRKEWQLFDLDLVKPVQYDGKAWDHLVLDADVKTLIKGLVEVSTKSMTASGALVSDVIAKKGGGLTSVLYGPPGTGKTLTAEAVAELLRRPLLTVGSSDLPRDPSGMEDTLRHVLKLATAWDAVLLIDEADVFLEQRSLHEIERNALVSVALRVLEYHRGVVFLTTNRIKVFDEAFLSRFSIAVKYPELNKPGRYLIWSRFLELAGYKIVSSPFVTDDDLNEKIIPRQSIEELAEKKFNGRTIKNLVRTAQALALSANSHLKMEHIHVVVRAQEKFLEDFAVERASP
ncbi:hypothetical protein E1B28_008192 [Marasmius oreades]|uniref:AAA+ ATPase domain-containing protein n=1 Tax=Marasmius oreades TaxID=181124 RepID=A0A9P7URV4_9AGAR|nr:uncharacterized protein E1B28_008192 [Marasmius oreades]KAG7091788.1 hypothetical protein E1B28_008192 [Marasmius oreades]